MESSVDWEQLCLINELTEGKELVKQLRNHLDPSSLTGELLIEKTLSSLERALSMVSTSSSRLNNNSGHHQLQQLTGSTSTIGMLESPLSASGSPQSDDNDGHRGGDVSKKRKGLRTWSEQIKVCPGTGLEGPVDDGHCWRKYGQKDILGALYPRSYYRCTYRNVQGCLATKQVQRSDENPLIFDVTYRGRHTCMQQPHLLNPTSQSHQNNNQEQDLKHKNLQHHQKPRSSESQEILLNFSSSSGFEVKSEDLEKLPDQPSSSYSFSFPSSTSTAIACIKGISNHGQSHNFVGSSTLDHGSTTANYYMGSCSFSPPNISPTYKNNAGGVGHNFESFESDFNEIVSLARAAATTSAAISPMINANFALDELELDPNFLFDSPDFLS